jgi:hypothetical protein
VTGISIGALLLLALLALVIVLLLRRRGRCGGGAKREGAAAAAPPPPLAGATSSDNPLSRARAAALANAQPVLATPAASDAEAAAPGKAEEAASIAF